MDQVEQMEQVHWKGPKHRRRVTADPSRQQTCEERHVASEYVAEKNPRLHICKYYLNLCLYNIYIYIYYSNMYIDIYIYVWIYTVYANWATGTLKADILVFLKNNNSWRPEHH